MSVGVLSALAIPVLLSIANALRWDTGIVLAILAFMPPLKIGMASIFGIRHKQGITYMSAFDATRALGTARLVGLKILVTVASILGAWMVIGTSLWFSLPLTRDIIDFAPYQREIVAALATVPGYMLAASAVVVLTQLSTALALIASAEAFLVLHARRLILTVLGLAGYVLVSVLALRGDWVGPSFLEAHAWIVAAAIPVGAVYVYRQALADRLLTLWHAGGAVLIWAGFAAAYFSVLAESGAFVDMPSAFIALMASLSLGPLAALAVAPWSFGLIRHR